MPVERRRSPTPANLLEDVPLISTPSPKPGNLDRYRRDLVIDKDDLDECLVRQPELFYHVAEAHSQAKAARDALKLDLEILEAHESQKIRDEHEQAERKGRLTEGDIAEQLLLIPSIQKLRRERIKFEAEIDDWLALKEAFQQRSYMLRELVPMYLSRLGSGSIRAGGNPRHAIADSVRERAGEERMRRRDNE